MSTHWNRPRQESRLTKVVKGLDQYAIIRVRSFEKQMKQIEKLGKMGAFDGTAHEKLNDRIEEKI